MIGTIAARELRSLFLSPLAWAILAVVQLILAYVFLIQLDLFIEWQPRLAAVEGAPGLTEVVAAPLFRTAAVVLLLVVPLLTMRVLSEERRARTLPLLLSAPVSMSAIVVGKYLGLMAFLGVMVGCVAAMPLALLVGGSLDLGLLAAGVLGLALVLGSFAAAGLFLSSLTEQPTVAAISTFGLLLLLWILDWAGSAGAERTGALLGYLSVLTHYDALLKGVFDTRDVVYYVLFIAAFLTLAVRRLDAERLQP
jgi:ABC-2 type transport system permease protein